MNKICTSIEQSKKLLELGIDVNTADMIYQPTMDIDSMSNVGFVKIPLCFSFNEVKECNIQYLPAWSLSALLELIQWDYKLEKTLFDQSDLFTYSIVCNDLDYRTYEHDNEPLDAAFEMVCWLKENEKI